MFLQTITVCINFSDYLESIVDNKALFDRWIIVTSAEDRQTQELCLKHGLEIHLTSVRFSPGSLFPKGAMINEAFSKLTSGDTWVLLLDADMKLPKDTRHKLESVCSNRRLYYTVAERLGKDGVVVPNYCCVEGFFQLFHYSQIRQYPEESIDTAGDDARFAAHWPNKEDKFIICDLLPEHMGFPGYNRTGVIPKKEVVQ